MLSEDWQRFLIMFPLLSEHQLTTGFELDEFVSSLQVRGMSTEGIDMVEQYIRSCWDKGVEVVLDPNLEGAFGYGGHCFPKDVKALTTLTEHSILTQLIKSNDSLKERR